jgi:hypothetical protein
MPRLNFLNITRPTEEQKLEKSVSAMNDSVSLINRLIESGKHTQNVHDSIRRNFSHIELMLGKDFIKNSETDLAPFEAAVSAGKTYIQSPISES